MQWCHVTMPVRPESARIPLIACISLGSSPSTSHVKMAAALNYSQATQFVRSLVLDLPRAKTMSKFRPSGNKAPLFGIPSAVQGRIKNFNILWNARQNEVIGTEDPCYSSIGIVAN